MQEVKTLFHDLNQVSEKDICKKLNEEGFFLFESIIDENSLLQLSQKFGDIFIHKDGNQNGITHIRNFDIDKDPDMPGLSAFSNAKQDLHTDRSGEITPPDLIVLYCTKPATKGGEVWILDGRKVYEELEQLYPETLKTFKQEGSIVFGGSKQLYNGSIFHVNESGKKVLRFRDDELGYFPTYIHPHLNNFYEVCEKHKIILNLKENQGYIIKNDRILHGRNSYQGERSMYRVLINSTNSSKLGQEIVKGF
jgi:alpha-ketoglutarate-dependent taurine dioxygenase